MLLWDSAYPATQKQREVSKSEQLWSRLDPPRPLLLPIVLSLTVEYGSVADGIDLQVSRELSEAGLHVESGQRGDLVGQRCGRVLGGRQRGPQRRAHRRDEQEAEEHRRWSALGTVRLRR